MSNKHGAPAFPSEFQNHGLETVEGFAGEDIPPNCISSYSGISIRDYFAAKALAALIGREDKNHEHRGDKAVPIMARFAYEYADAMLAERAK